MNGYLVLKAFDAYKPGDTVSLNARQAKYLLLNGLIKVKPTAKPKPQPQEK
jgi:hypothetical protein